MTRAWAMFRRVLKILLVFAIAGVAGFGVLAWSLRPRDVPLAPPVLPSGPTQPLQLSITSGKLVGYRDGKIMVFKGIPYAAPPVGPLRWRPPQPVTAWSGLRDATKFGDDCWQNKQMYEAARPPQPMSEDCLTINVWAPVANRDRMRPVMLWIHGGGFVIGSSSQPITDGSALARRGVVVVTFNYRLGRFGFFAHPALLAEAQGRPVGNWGLMDQLYALRWVHENIVRFGGDPDRVTLFGQSAGGASVAQMMLDPSVRGLFSQAIIQSSGGRNRWTGLYRGTGSQPSGIAAGIEFAKEQGLINASADQLRALSAATVLGDISMTKLSSKSYAGPMIDGIEVKSNFVDGFVAGNEARVPLIVGSTNGELSALPWVARRVLRGWARDELAPALDRIEMAYGTSSAFDENIVNDWGFNEPARMIARVHSAHAAPTWLYRFAYVSESRRGKIDGASHASEIPFIFGTLGHEGIEPRPMDWAASRTISSQWIAFAKRGQPDSERWPQFGRDERLTKFGDDGMHGEGVPRARMLDAISERYATYK